MSLVLCEKNTFVDELSTSDIGMRSIKSEPTSRSHPTTHSQELTDYILAFADRAACLKDLYVDYASPRSSNAPLIHEKRSRVAMQVLETCDTMPMMSKERIPLLTMDEMEPFPDTDDEFGYDSGSRMIIRGGSRVLPIDTSESFPEIDDLSGYYPTSRSSTTTWRPVPTRDTIESLPETDGEFGYDSKSQMTIRGGRHILPMDTSESFPDFDDLFEFDRTSRSSTTALKLVATRDTIESLPEIEDDFGYDSNSQMTTRGGRHVVPVDTSELLSETNDLLIYDRSSRPSTTALRLVATRDTVESLLETEGDFGHDSKSQMTRGGRHILPMGTRESFPETDDLFEYDCASQSSTTARRLVPKRNTLDSLPEVDDEFLYNSKGWEATKDSRPLLPMEMTEPFLDSEARFEDEVKQSDPLLDSWSPQSFSAPASRKLRVESRIGIEENDNASEVAATTLMVCNMPCKLSQEDLVRHIDELGFAGTYDFVYLPLGKGSSQFLGYGFINFCTPGHAKRFASAFASYNFYTENTVKHVEVKIAKTQGLENMLASIQKSPNFRKRSHAPLIFSPHRPV